MGAHLQQRAGRIDGRVADQRRLIGVGLGQDEAAPATAARHRERHRQRAADRAQFTRQRQLAGEFIVVQGGAGNLTGGGQDAERDRQVKLLGTLLTVRLEFSFLNQSLNAPNNFSADA